MLRQGEVLVRMLAERVPEVLIDVAVLLSSHWTENAQMRRVGQATHSHRDAQSQAE